ARSWRGAGEPGGPPPPQGDPCPARAEPLHAAVVDRRLQVVNSAEDVVDRRAEVAARGAPSARLRDLPEQRGVRVAAAVVADGRLLVVRRDVGERSEELLDRA